MISKMYGIRIGSLSTCTITHHIEIRVNGAMTRQRDDDGAMIIAQWCNDNEEMKCHCDGVGVMKR